MGNPARRARRARKARVAGLATPVNNTRTFKICRALTPGVALGTWRSVKGDEFAGDSSPLLFILGGDLLPCERRPGLHSTARVQRGPSEAARCASTKGDWAASSLFSSVLCEQGRKPCRQLALFFVGCPGGAEAEGHAGGKVCLVGLVWPVDLVTASWPRPCRFAKYTTAYGAPVPFGGRLWLPAAAHDRLR